MGSDSTASLIITPLLAVSPCSHIHASHWMSRTAGVAALQAGAGVVVPALGVGAGWLFQVSVLSDHVVAGPRTSSGGGAVAEQFTAA